MNDQQLQSPGLIRRLAAMLYDSFLVLGIVIISLLPAPLIDEALRLSLQGKIMIRMYLLGVVFMFFGWFWTHRGQTLGMRAWRIKLVSERGTRVTWSQALQRYLTICMFVIGILSVAVFFLPVIESQGRPVKIAYITATGILMASGHLCCLIHPKNYSIFDLITKTKLIVIPGDLRIT